MAASEQTRQSRTRRRATRATAVVRWLESVRAGEIWGGPG